MAEVYHIFEVKDYKGGELYPNTNLSKESLINELLDTQPLKYIYDLKTIEEVEKALENFEFHDATYAGSDEQEFCGEIYASTPDGKLREVYFSEFEEDMKNQIRKNWKDYNA